jgi:hypothetical protein
MHRRLIAALSCALSFAALAGCTGYEAPAGPYGTAAAPCPPPPPSWAGGDAARQGCNAPGGLYIYPPGVFEDSLPRYYYVPGVYPPVVIGGNP